MTGRMQVSRTTVKGWRGVVAPFLVMWFGSIALAQERLVGLGAHRFDSGWDEAVQVAVGGSGLEALLRVDGTVVVSGSNRDGECDVPPPPPGVTDVQVAVGDRCVMVLQSDGQIRAFGSDRYGQLQVPPLPAGMRYTALSDSLGAGGFALRSDGSPVGWVNGEHWVWSRHGGLRYVQIASPWVLLLEDGSVVSYNFYRDPASVPELPAGVRYVKVADGDSHGLALRSDGLTESWWLFPAVASPNLPVPPAGLSYVDISAALEVSYGVRSDGQLIAAGDFNLFGQLDVPPLPPGVRYTAVSSAGFVARALRSDGRVVRWGSADGYAGTAPSTRPGEEVERVVAGTEYTAVLRRDGSVVAFGARDLQGTHRANAGRRFVELAGGSRHVCMLDDAGHIAHAGDNRAGQGDVPPAPPGSRYVGVGAGSAHSLGILSNGDLVGFGDNSYGQCDPPGRPPGVDYVAAAGGPTYSLAIRSDGEVVHFGEADPLGLPGTRLDAIPPLPAGVTYRKVAAARFHCVALRSDGQVVGWGDGRLGQTTVPQLPRGVYYVDLAVTAEHYWYTGDDDPRYSALLRSDGEIELLGPAPVRPSDLPATDPGSNFGGFAGSQQLAVFHLVPARRFEPVGTGCPGTQPAAQLIPQVLPRVGGSLSLSVRGLPEDLGVMLIGQEIGRPLDLGPFGFTGCTVFTSGEITGLLVGSGGEASFDIELVADRVFVGARICLQAAVADGGASGGLVFSEATTAVVGR